MTPVCPPVGATPGATECQCACHRSPDGITVKHLVPCCWPAPLVATDSPDELPEFVTVESRTGTSARAWCCRCDFGSNWSSPREAFDWAYAHVAERHQVTQPTKRRNECDNDNHKIGCQCPGIVRPDYVGAVAEIRALIARNPRPPVTAPHLMRRWKLVREIAAILDKAGCP